jgi:hypothetical protein
MFMSEEKVKEALDQAVGNVKIEGQDVSNEEKKMILDIYQKYKGNIDEKAITLLLKYLEINKKDLGEKERETHKK